MSKSISFVITTKNEEKYIKYTCLSIKNQDPTIRKKIILVDAESTDETVKIAKRFADIIIVKKSNIAQGKNIGASATNDELIAFINADVLLEKKWLKEMLEAFNDENVIAACGLIKPYENTLKARIFSLLWNLFIRIMFLIHFPHTSGECSIIVKKEYFNKIGGFNENLSAFEDVDLGLRLSKFGKIKLMKNCYTIASLRRFEREGYLKWIIIWLLIGIYYLFTKRTFLKEYPLVR
jgi:Predicted glycosyltransferases